MALKIIYPPSAQKGRTEEIEVDRPIVRIAINDHISAKEIRPLYRPPPGIHVQNSARVLPSEGGGTRTLDLRIKSPLLYRLSYAFSVLNLFSEIGPLISMSYFALATAAISVTISF
jgi:hypothetical protein